MQSTHVSFASVDFAEFVFDLCRKMKHSHEKMQPVCKFSRAIANCLTCELEQVNKLEHETCSLIRLVGLGV